MYQERHSKILSIDILMGMNSHFGETTDNDQDSIVAIQQWEAFYEVHRNRIPRSYGNQEETKQAKRLMVDGLASVAGQAGSHVISDKLDELGPVELVSDVTNHLADAWMSCEAMVMVGVENVQMDICMGT